VTRGSLFRFCIRRLIGAVFLMLGVTLVAFVLTTQVPGNPALAALGETGASDPVAVKAYEHHMGLDKPIPVQYLTYLGHLLAGDLGTSRLTGNPVADDLKQYAPASIELAILAIVLALVIGVTAGTVAAMLRDSPLDQGIRIVSLVGVSMPIFWLALVSFYLFVYKYPIFPGIGRLDPGAIPPPHVTGLYTVDALLAGQWGTFKDALSHLLLPAFVLAAYTVSLLTRFSRSAVLDVLGNDFVRTARAKGLPEKQIGLRHVLRAALVPIVTVAGVMLGILLSGTVFVESIFDWPGLGQYAYRSATNLDLPAIMGVTVFIALIYIVINFMVDLLYGVIDPRIRLG
jgi:peptide/nickel transport system permease protein